MKEPTITEEIEIQNEIEKALKKVKQKIWNLHRLSMELQKIRR